MPNVLAQGRRRLAGRRPLERRVSRRGVPCEQLGGEEGRNEREQGEKEKPKVLLYAELPEITSEISEGAKSQGIGGAEDERLPPRQGSRQLLSAKRKANGNNEGSNGDDPEDNLI